MKLLYLIAMMTIFMGACTQNSTSQNPPSVLNGLDVLEQNNFAQLEGLRVGLITNATGVNKHLISNIDLLHEAENVDLVALFGPEHGVRGDINAGDYVETYVDERTGITVFSVYGSTRKPTQEMLEGIDILIYDIQDVGSRSYTFISTMGLAMEAAAEKGIAFMVLDRPNPLGGKIEGNITEPDYISFVSQFAIPYVYGLTSGELAKMLNGERMLTNGVQVDLTVIPIQGWNRNMTFEDTGLPWVPTSPHIPHRHSAIFYTATGIIGELHTLSEGVGYTMPFELLGAPWIDAQVMADRMNNLGLEGIRFRPKTWRPYYGRHQGEVLHGVQLYIDDFFNLNIMSIQFLFMQEHHILHPDKNPFDTTPARIRMFDRVMGSSTVRELFSQNFRYADIEEFLNKDIEAFRELSKPYLLYP
ncbi:MAG: DUF1343 domain-containing protein [Bacteroidetes bacterium]|nr:DUF1343 domain-containing protein [Bacteroidota bacterium]MCH8524429.1 DUF1343 domain-containing protein [Balneolales bacterium]